MKHKQFCFCVFWFQEPTPGALSFRLNPAVALKDRPTSLYPEPWISIVFFKSESSWIIRFAWYQCVAFHVSNRTCFCNILTIDGFLEFMAQQANRETNKEGKRNEPNKPDQTYQTTPNKPSNLPPQKKTGKTVKQTKCTENKHPTNKLRAFGVMKSIAGILGIPNDR